jgi:hypothetical protein
MDNSKVIYQLIVEDIQTVAKECFGRELSDEEIGELIEPIGESIAWYDIIHDTIIWKLRLEEVEQAEDDL